MRLGGREAKESALLSTYHKGRGAVRAQVVQASIGTDRVGADLTTLANSDAA